MKKRTALVLTGLARDFNLAADSIYRNIIKPFSISPSDIFIEIWSDKGYWYPGDALVKKSFLETQEITHADVENYYPGSQVNIENYGLMESTFQNRLNFFPEEFRSDLNHSNYFVRGINLISMFYKINKGIRQIQGKDFDLVIRTRPDIYLPRKLRIFNKSKLHILKQRNHLGTGLGDNLHIGSTKDIAMLGEIYNHLEEIFVLSDRILCPHLFVETWISSNSILYREFLMRGWATLHTPAGQYKALNSARKWVDLGDADYSRGNNRFNGSL